MRFAALLACHAGVSGVSYHLNTVRPLKIAASALFSCVGLKKELRAYMWALTPVHVCTVLHARSSYGRGRNSYAGTHGTRVRKNTRAGVMLTHAGAAQARVRKSSYAYAHPWAHISSGTRAAACVDVRGGAYRAQA